MDFEDNFVGTLLLAGAVNLNAMSGGLHVLGNLAKGIKRLDNGCICADKPGKRIETERSVGFYVGRNIRPVGDRSRAYKRGNLQPGEAV